MKRDVNVRIFNYLDTYCYYWVLQSPTHVVIIIMVDF